MEKRWLWTGEENWTCDSWTYTTDGLELHHHQPIALLAYSRSPEH